MTLRQIYVVALLAATGLLAGCSDTSSEKAGATERTVIRLNIDPMALNLALTEDLARQFEKETSATVEIIRGPADATERLAQYMTYLGAKSADIDIYQVDVIWPATLADHMIDLTEAFADEKDEFFPAIIENNTIGGRLVCVPWFADAGMLYYRDDLLKKYDLPVPATYDDMTTIATAVQEKERAAGNADFWGYVWQGKAYEGLTCNALEWQKAEGGGTIVEQDGTVNVNNPAVRAALKRAAGWVGTISPPGVLTYQEDEARNLFQSGNAAFMRNWPYAWALGQSPDSNIRDKFVMAPLPGGPGGRASALGGWQLGVSKYSKNKELATQFVKLLTSAEAQKRRALEASMLPTRTALYDDPELEAAMPFVPAMKTTFLNATPRPARQSGARYNQLSSQYFRTVHRILSKQIEADEGLKQLEESLPAIMGSGN